MSLHFDVKAVHVSATGVALTGPVRVKGYQIGPGGSAGDIIFHDNASAASGTVRLQFNITTNTAAISTVIPADGIKFFNGVYVTLPAGAAITIFYG